MTRKIISLVLACLMAATVLTACGSGATPAASSSAASSEAASAPVSSGDALPAYSEITVEVFDRGTDGGKTDPTNNFYTDWIKEKAKKDLNLGVTFKAVSRWEETEQLNNLMAANSAPDLCLTYSQDLITNYRDLGGLTDLSPYVDTLLKDVKEFLGEDTSLPGKDLIMRDVVPETGKLFDIPARRVNVAGANTFIRKDWLDKLGLKVPTTKEEYFDALVQFKEKDPGKVGKDKVIPFTATDDIRWRASNIVDSFIDPNLSEKDRYVNTCVDRFFLLPGYKEGVRYLNKMYNAGLIDPQFPLYKGDQESDNLIKSGVVGSFIHNWDQAYRESPGLLIELKKTVPDAEFITIDPFKNAAGKTPKFQYDKAGVKIFVPASSKNPEGAVRYLNWITKFENRYFLQVGEEGVTHKMVDGVPKIITATGPKIMNSALNIDYTLTINGLDLNDDAKNLQATANSYSFDKALITEAYENSMRDGVVTPVRSITLTAAGPVTQTLQDKGKALMAESIKAPEAKFDAVWDAGIKDWLASGAQAVIDERAQKYYDLK
ncbi:extracellular solute-binding protein [Acetanaerobacterium elongatum]|uniref:Carbohydrate ABC transporter substrate-binding protein, CUT1 family n=1 Tax=Acetanaerobacterium elongatum TaxID=258515 RepID=A0A1H0C7N0_9FIRM|nr:extracellular solute-binding protein [Acetanaerobacterium elongatum]SDN53904.1 carbohydrate ABC transporter substrate-binding protein, CUT1 family [Acetanaerobacterium elongatum]